MVKNNSERIIETTRIFTIDNDGPEKCPVCNRDLITLYDLENPKHVIRAQQIYGYWCEYDGKLYVKKTEIRTYLEEWKQERIDNES